MGSWALVNPLFYKSIYYSLAASAIAKPAVNLAINVVSRASR